MKSGSKGIQREEGDEGGEEGMGSGRKGSEGGEYLKYQTCIK